MMEAEMADKPSNEVPRQPTQQIALSKPSEKDTMTALVKNFLQ